MIPLSFVQQMLGTFCAILCMSCFMLLSGIPYSSLLVEPVGTAA